MAIKEYKGIIDDGTREIPLYNNFGKLICRIHIRPADFSILDRYNDLSKDLDKVLAPLKDIDIKNDGTAKFDKDWQVVKKVEAELMRRINALFDMDEAEDIFATRNPFSSVGGRFFCLNVISAIGEIITEAVNDEMELSRQRTDLYLDDIQPEDREVGGDVRKTTTGT